MSTEQPQANKTILRSARLLDVDAGRLITPASVLIEGDRIAAVGVTNPPRDAEVVDLGDVTLLPGLMDMELNLLMGGPAGPMASVQDDPALKTLRGVLNARTTLLAGFTTVRNLGLFVQTGGLLLDVALMRAIDAGWIDGPRVVPAGHAITPTGGHLDPTMFQGLAPGIMPLSVEEGICDGVEQVRRAVRYQIKYGAQVIKVCASGGVMSLTGSPGAQHFSDDELRAIVDEAHRRGIKVAAHAHGDQGIRAGVEAGIDCIEHGSLMSKETMEFMIKRGTFLVATSYLAEGLDVSRVHPALRAKAEEVFPQAKENLRRAIKAGMRIACGTDAPAIPHGHNAKELWALVDRGMAPIDAIRAATIVSADLIGVNDRARVRPGLLADLIAVPGNPLDHIEVTQDVQFVMKGGKIYKAPM
ncbi:MAG TPA: amidohydrolase family protein [Candidatus Binataceae bacterium]|jgi:imidazolonepropionase-like amidohydrolase|nr:amidohydrolase family protein [Candidatus Binataceae bacterium]